MQRPFAKLKHQPSLPEPARTPAPERSRVVSNPTRLPINRQAALAIRQKRCWLEEPLPEKPMVVTRELYDKSLAELKIERNRNAELADALGVLRESVRVVKEQLVKSNTETGRLRSEIRDLKETIRQLEDLKL